MHMMSPFTLEFHSWQQGAELEFPVPMVPIAEANEGHGGPPVSLQLAHAGILRRPDLVLRRGVA